MWYNIRRYRRKSLLIMKVYLETTFVSWLTAKPSTMPENAVRQAYTHKWWEERAGKCELFVSGFVVQEAQAGDAERAQARLAVIGNLNLLDGDIEEVKQLAQALLDEHAVPATETTDAYHIATAAVYGMDMLLTWNCKHMANLVTLPKTAGVIARFGYQCPMILTPENALEVKNG